MPPRRKAASAKKATPASAKSHKRQLSDATPVATPGSRTSKRIKESTDRDRSTGKATPTKSKYVEEEDDEEDDYDEVEGDDGSGYEDEANGDAGADEVTSEEVESEDEDEDEDESEEEDTRPKKRQPKKGAKAGGGRAVANAVTGKGKELWREGVKTGLGPGQQVFIEKPKPRGDGGTKYVPGKIHPNTMAFLKDLKANNNREWLKMHDPDYRQSWKDWESFVETLTEKISELDETIPELPPKDLVWIGFSALQVSE